MRSTVAVPVLLAAASAAPTLAFPVASSSTGSEAVNWKKVGNVAGDIGKVALHFLREDQPAGSQAINWHNVGNDFKQFGEGLISREAPTGSKAVNWQKVGNVVGDVGKVALHFLREENPILARAFEDELLARADAGSQAINWHNVGNDFKQFGEGLISREAPTGSEAVNWQKVGNVVGDVGKVALHFLREENPILARAFEDELLARADSSEAVNWKTVGTIASDAGRVALHFLREDGSQAINWHNVGHDVEQFGEGVIGREEPAGSQAVNWKTVGTIAGDAGRVALHFLREEDPILARRFDLKPISRIFDTHFPFRPSRLARDEELLARADGSEAINRHNIVFGRAAPAGSEAVNWKKVGSVAGDIGKVALHFLRNDELAAREFVLNELD